MPPAAIGVAPSGGDLRRPGAEPPGPPDARPRRGRSRHRLPHRRRPWLPASTRLRCSHRSRGGHPAAHRPRRRRVERVGAGPSCRASFRQRLDGVARAAAARSTQRPRGRLGLRLGPDHRPADPAVGGGDIAVIDMLSQRRRGQFQAGRNVASAEHAAILPGEEILERWLKSKSGEIGVFYRVRRKKVGRFFCGCRRR